MDVHSFVQPSATEILTFYNHFNQSHNSYEISICQLKLWQNKKGRMFLWYDVFFSVASCKKDIIFGGHLKQIFGPSYLVFSILWLVEIVVEDRTSFLIDCAPKNKVKKIEMTLLQDEPIFHTCGQDILICYYSPIFFLI